MNVLADARGGGGLWLRTAVATLVFFVVVVAAEHLLIPGLSPATHQLSEYANSSQWGWLMTVGFASWAVSLLTSAEVVRHSDTLQGHRVRLTLLVGLLAIAGLAMIITAWFHTQTVAGAIPRGHTLTTAGRLHDVGSGTTTLALFLAAVVSTRMAGANQRWFRTATWSAIVAAVGIDLVLLVVGTGVGGIRERVLVAIGCAWQACLLRAAGT